MFRPTFLLTLTFFIGASHLNQPAFCQKPLVFKKSKLIFKDNFKSGPDTGYWQVETKPGAGNKVYTGKKRLWLDTNDGVTVWFKKPITGNYCIEYKRCVVLDSGKNDRLSDLNNFWQASNPQNANLFTRDGVFESYDNLQLYYAGIGGNYNSTSRFRKYDGSKEKPVLKEYLDSAHLLKPNHIYTIRIVYLNHTTQLYVDGDLWFNFTESKPLPAGYFGLRSTKSRQWVSGLKIWVIKQAGIRMG